LDPADFPKLVRRVAPKYTEPARAAGVQGIVLIEVLIDAGGKVTNPVVLNSLGFGLDEAAVDAVRRWEYKPVVIEGKRVCGMGTLQVNFTLLGRPADDKYEQRRADYNADLSRFARLDGPAKTAALKEMRRLAREGFAPAMFALATFIEDGRVTPEGTENAAELLTKAADLKHPAAMYEVGRRSLLGQGFPVDREKGLQLIREAASQGNPQAQLSLGNRYETGEGLPRDRELALKHYRLCAAGEPACQYSAARILLAMPSRKDRDVVEAVARLELAADQSFAPARTLLDQERPNVTPSQAKHAAELKKALSPPR
jgi:TonB family C-terminal domain